MTVDLVRANTLLKDRYLIVKKLSEKEGRLAFLARDTESSESVAIKLLLFGGGAVKWQDFKLFEREAQTLKELNHPQIPKYLDYFDIDAEDIKGFALVQTYIDAPSLEDVMKDGRKFSESELIEFSEKILEVLSYLHQQIPPVIHRDIKPSNILISNRSAHSIGNVYLVDFGAAQVTANKDNGTITIVGSYGYIPLEQFGGQTTPASDLYSLGMTLIYLITGVHPADLEQVNGQVHFDSSELSGKFDQWLDKMIHPHVNKRFDCAKSALTALRSPDGNSGDFLHLRPADTKVKLHRDKHKLTIVYPVLVVNQGCFPTFILFFSYFFSFLFLGLIGIAGNTIFIGLVVTTFIVLFLGICQSFLSDNPLYCTISIDKNNRIKKEIYMNEKLTKMKRSLASSPAKSINLLVYNPGYTFDKYLDEHGKAMKRGEVEISPSLSIYVGSFEYKIGEYQIFKSTLNVLTRVELWWLAKELSDFLGLEIQVMYPIPQEPPEPSSCGGC